MAKKSDAKRQHILSVAAQAFQEHGFERTSMSEICARVGGSKATLYNYFPSKDELFFEVMTRSNNTEFEAVFRSIDPAAEDIAASLRDFGRRWLTFLYSPTVKANRHLAISVSGRSDLGRLMFERGVLRGQDLAADLLRTAMGLGRLRQADPVVASRHLLSLLESELMERFLFQVLDKVSDAEIKQVTDRAIDVFMAAYGRSRG
ncbi:TetR/AcrR family transcriptional regulator [Geobacter grbiciae]|uniref:TetR/AcrR family transcriptional regulator n=1 Tax=Geobacter grbiciae TaxID=155042 RepID=UPI001C035B74|nr:TetR/AcrR family transcriptional regulator [Geobacter grbiciae]MBT1075431.1 TetR/AcrR family transcriptional regulator [Geobacter grbiciae]